MCHNNKTEYIFETSATGVKPKQSQELVVHKKGWINLYFLRYGMFYKPNNSEENNVTEKKKFKWSNVSYIQTKKEKVIRTTMYFIMKPDSNDTKTQTVEVETIKTNKIEGINTKNSNYDIIPQISNFKNAETLLNSGYIYILKKLPKSEKDIDMYFEYQVFDGNTMLPIFWDVDKLKRDIRKPEINSDFVYYHSVEIGSTVYVAYSPVQWSIKFVQDMISNKDKRMKFMTKVECNGFTEKEEQGNNKNVLDIFNLNLHFSHTATELLQIHPEQPKMEQIMREIAIKEAAEAEEKKKIFYEDMFVVLHDPVGAVNDIADTLVLEHNRFDALLESIQTGISQNGILKKKYGIDFSKLINPTREDNLDVYFSQHAAQNTGYRNMYNTTEKQDFKAIFDMALTTYQLVHSNKEMKDKYAYCVDEKKIEKLLAVKERKKQSAIIESIRKDMRTLMSDNYYLDALTYYIENCDEHRFEGFCTVSNQLAVLSVFSKNHDRFLKLQEEYKKDEEKGNEDYITYFQNIIDSQKYKNITDLIKDKTIDMTDMLDREDDSSYYFSMYFVTKTGFKISRQLAKSNKNILDAYANTPKIKEYQFKLFKNCVYGKKEKTPVFEVNNGEYKKFVEKFGEELKYSDVKLIKYNKKNSTNGNAKVRLGRGNQYYSDGKFKFNVKRNGAERITKILEMPSFLKFFAALEVLNVGFAIADFIKDPKNIKNGANLSAASSFLAQATLKYKASCLTKIDAKSFSTTIVKYKNYASYSGWFGSSINIVIFAWDSAEYLVAGDIDASCASAVAAVATTVLLLKSMGAITLGLTATAFFEVTLLVACISIIFLKDNPLEEFLKNSVIGSAHSFKYTGGTDSMQPYQYARKLYKERKLCIGSKYHQYRNYVETLNILGDYMPAYSTDIYYLQLEKEKRVCWDYVFVNNVEKILTPLSYDSVQFPLIIKIRTTFYEPIYNLGEFYFQLYFNSGSVSKYPLYPHIPIGTMSHFKEFLKLIPIVDYKKMYEYEDGVFYTTDENNRPVLDIYYTLEKYNMPLNFILTENSVFMFASRLLIDVDEKKYWPRTYNGNERLCVQNFYSYYNKYKNAQKTLKNANGSYRPKENMVITINEFNKL